MTFRLVIGHTRLDGPWIYVTREFVRLGEAAEELRVARRMKNPERREPLWAKLKCRQLRTTLSKF